MGSCSDLLGQLATGTACPSLASALISDVASSITSTSSELAVEIILDTAERYIASNSKIEIGSGEVEEELGVSYGTIHGGPNGTIFSLALCFLRCELHGKTRWFLDLKHQIWDGVMEVGGADGRRRLGQFEIDGDKHTIPLVFAEVHVTWIFN